MTVLNTIIQMVQAFAAALFAAPVEGVEGNAGGLVWQFFGFLTDESVLPFFLLGVLVSLVLLSIKIVRGVVWGA